MLRDWRLSQTFLFSSTLEKERKSSIFSIPSCSRRLFWHAFANPSTTNLTEDMPFSRFSKAKTVLSFYADTNSSLDSWNIRSQTLRVNFSGIWKMRHDILALDCPLSRVFMVACSKLIKTSSSPTFGRRDIRIYTKHLQVLFLWHIRIHWSWRCSRKLTVNGVYMIKSFPIQYKLISF